MVRVPEDDPGTHFLQLTGFNGLYSALRTDGHKDGCRDLTMGGLNRPGTREAVGMFEAELQDYKVRKPWGKINQPIAGRLFGPETLPHVYKENEHHGA